MADDIQIPEEGDGKVVQLVVEGRPILRTGVGKEHADILELALRELNLGFKTRNVGGKDIPLLEGDMYNVPGMGHYTRCENTVSVRGFSCGYEMGINPDHMEQCRPFLAERGINLMVG